MFNMKTLIKKSVVCALCAMVSLGAKAELRQAIGYGVGDDLEQAIVVAKADAILNVEGRTTVATEVANDRLVKDEGTSENDAYLISYEVIDKGESFDGTYVRIKAKVSKDEYYVLKDGTTDVRGEGMAESAHDAVVMAICNAVVESGSRISTLVKYEDDQLVADDVKVEARGAVVSCSIENPGEKKSKVACRIYPDANSLTGFFPVKVSGVGEGRNIAVAEAAARRDMVLGWGSEFFVHLAYKDGELKSFSAERKCDAYISAEMAQDSAGLGNGSARMDGTKFQNASGLEFFGPKSADGIGCGVDVVAAHKAALCDAFVNLGSHVVINVDYADGRKTGENAIYCSSYNYFGENPTAPEAVGGEYFVKTAIRAGGELPAVDAGIAQTVETVGYGKGKDEAVKDAKQRAVDMVFGSPVKVSVTERDGEIADIAYTATHSEKGYVAECDILSEDKYAESTIVKIKAVVKNHDGDSAGWGWITVTIVIFVMCGVFTWVKEKMGVVMLTIVWVFTAIGLFATGHWAVGIAAIVFGLAAAKND